MGGDGAGVDRGDHAQDVRPLPPDAVEVDAPAYRGVECAVVGLAVDQPELRVREVGQLRAVVEAEQPHQGEDDVAVGAGVGDDHLRPGARVLAVDQIDHVQRVTRGAGDHATGESDGLVAEHVQPRGATPAPEVLRVRPRVKAADRDDKPHSVDPGHEPAAPAARERDLVLGGDQDGVGGGVVLRAQVVLVDMADPTPGQRRDALGDDRDVPDVQGVCGERRGDAHVQVRQTSAASGGADERLGEPGVPGHHLEDQIGEPDPREHRLQATPQVDQARRVRNCVDLARVQPALGVNFDLAICGQLAPGAVELRGLLFQQLAGIVQEA